eukprot:CAMPEP_0197702616 /NCGR_PEP_ID=MMETSP1338-20131121/124735_1 /TAXON_ID=43686 ORGANISM="Pelagodinium beii, Strain RCC1491" /NCGR_SAMPLE_ID=MMETSP1338 /ASSEMBLY_ACC=CAM_ASM_000754 /LENGTH=66 /DNA_ID=CAMNT_0043286471 /DNA_START=27 /DNA_END=225 /DNA_ORIENTATION=+
MAKEALQSAYVSACSCSKGFSAENGTSSRLSVGASLDPKAVLKLSIGGGGARAAGLKSPDLGRVLS